MTDNLTNKRAFVHQANKNRTEASDLMKKHRIVKLLHNRFGLNALGLVDEFYYFRDRITNQVKISRSNPNDVSTIHELFSKYEVQRMDLYINSAPLGIIIEIDGLEHGFFDDITESEQTTDRNLNYKKGGYSKENKNYLLFTTKDLEEDDDSLVTLTKYTLGIREKI